MTARLWSRYALALEVFQRDPSPANEGIVIQAYAEFARSFCPEQADELVAEFGARLTARRAHAA